MLSEVTMKTNKIREVIVFTDGDSTSLTTWSNVPYFFTRTLESKGIKVNRVDISSNKYFKYVFSKTLSKILSKIFAGHVFTYERTRLNCWLTNKKIKKSTKLYPDSDANIFITFSFYNKYSNKPSILFCDWTYEILIHERLNRKAYEIERKYILYQKNVIESAQIIISLFPKCTEYMRKSYKNEHIYHLGSNVINSCYEKELNFKSILEIKSKSNELLFIGNEKYFKGATMLIEAYKILCSKYKNLRLNIVGMKEEIFSNLPEGVNCYGYLKKDILSEKNLYYKLLIGAKALINPTPQWGGYSSTIEAMYFYNPIITTPYEDFVESFGKELSFGYYCTGTTIDDLFLSIEKLLISKDYSNLCDNAHTSVSTYTWDSYINKFTNRINDIL